MEKYLNPKNIGDYNTKAFWDNAFTKYSKDYDWYGNYVDFKQYFQKYIQKKDSILIVGCGNSSMGEKLYDNGFRNITCVDYSEKVIETMKKRKGKRDSLLYKVMDVTHMTFDSESFDVVIDKACIDAIYAENNEKCKQDASTYLSEVIRVLKKNGRFFTISMSQDFICHLYYQMMKSFDTTAYFIGEPQKAVLTNPLFLLVTDFSQSSGFHLAFDSLDGFFRYTKENQVIQRVNTEDEFVDQIKETRFFFNARNDCRNYHDNCKECWFSFTTGVVSDEGEHKYRFSLWDTKRSEGVFYLTCAILVPCGKEDSLAYTSYDSILQFIEQIKCDRLIMISRMNKPIENRAITSEMVEKDCSGILPLLIPDGGQRGIQIFTPPEDEVRVEIASGKLSSGTGFLIQDMKMESEPRKGVRQLLFTSNLKAVQSEIPYHLVGQKKKKRVFDFDILEFDIHRMMAASLLLCPPLSSQPRILVLGLGGGCLPSFFKTNFPDASITAVDLDAEVIRIAREFFKLDPSIETVEMDALAYVEKECGHSSYDYIFVDIDEKDNHSSSSFPPMPFLTKQFMEKLKCIQNEGGVIVYNISSAKQSFYNVCERQFRTVFTNLFTHKTCDVNVVFIASDRTIIKEEDIEKERTEVIKDYMKGYSFNTHYDVCFEIHNKYAIQRPLLVKGGQCNDSQRSLEYLSCILGTTSISFLEDSLIHFCDGKTCI